MSSGEPGGTVTDATYLDRLFDHVELVNAHAIDYFSISRYLAGSSGAFASKDNQGLMGPKT